MTDYLNDLKQLTLSESAKQHIIDNLQTRLSEKKRGASLSVKQFKIAAATVLSAVVICGVVVPAIVLNLDGNNVPPDDSNIPPDDDMRALSVTDIYINGSTASFALLKIKSVEPDIYCDPSYLQSEYIVFECEVEEDYYGKLAEGECVYLPVTLNKVSGNYYSETAVRECFKENDEILSYFLPSTENLLVSQTTAEERSFDYLARVVELSLFYIIPVSDGTVDMNKICSFLQTEEAYYEHIYWDFTDYFADGMTLADAGENIRRLAEITYREPVLPPESYSYIRAGYENLTEDYYNQKYLCALQIREEFGKTQNISFEFSWGVNMYSDEEDAYFTNIVVGIKNQDGVVCVLEELSSAEFLSDSNKWTVKVDTDIHGNGYYTAVFKNTRTYNFPLSLCDSENGSLTFGVWLYNGEKLVGSGEQTVEYTVGSDSVVLQIIR